MDNSTYLLFNYLHNRKNGFCIFNRKTQTIIHLEKTMRDGLLRLLGPPLLLTDDNTCYFAVPASLVVQVRNSLPGEYNQLKNEWPALYQYLETVSMSTNYFLIAARLKF